MAIAEALSDEGQARARAAQNPYVRPDTLALTVKAIAETPVELMRTKKFYDMR